METKSDVCPNCGYCPHCGRGAQLIPSYPLYPWYPAYPYPTWIGPIWNVTSNTGDYFPNPTTTTC